MKILSPVELLSRAEVLLPGDSFVYYTGAFAHDIAFSSPERRSALWKLREASQVLASAKLVETPCVKRADMMMDYIMRRLNTPVPPGVRFEIQRLEDLKVSRFVN